MSELNWEDVSGLQGGYNQGGFNKEGSWGRRGPVVNVSFQNGSSVVLRGEKLNDVVASIPKELREKLKNLSISSDVGSYDHKGFKSTLDQLDSI